MNATLQALANCPRFHAIVKVLAKVFHGDNKFYVIRLLGEIFGHIYGTRPVEHSEDLMQAFLAILAERNVWNKPSSMQCDAHEFTITLLRHIEECCAAMSQKDANNRVDEALANGDITNDEVAVLADAEVYLPKGDLACPVKVNHGFTVAYQVLGCRLADGRPCGEQFVMGSDDRSNCIPVDVEAKDLPNGIGAWSRTTVDYRLEDNQYGQVLKEIKIFGCPNYLIFLINRFSKSGQKDNNQFDFGRNLDIPTIEGDVPYELRSVVSHHGGPDSGHYECFQVVGGEMQAMNDSYVRWCTDAEISDLCGDGTHKMNAYMLIYSKSKADSS
jgi:ubiquitin C-terminal hydrolase